MLHLKDNLKLIRALLRQTQVEFISNFTGKITVDMQKSYESGKAKPDILYIQELSDLTGISEKELTSKKLVKSDFKGMVEKELKVEKEKTTTARSSELLAAEEIKIFRGLVVARISTIEANIRVLNNKLAELNEKITGEKATITLIELEQTTREVAKMLREELEKMFL